MQGKRWIVVLWLLMAMLSGCKDVFNAPYPLSWFSGKTLFLAMSEAPKTLDPSKAYTTTSSAILGQIVEPPLTYDYFKRPYQLTPLLLQTMPTYDADKHLWTLTFKSNVLYQSHEALCRYPKCTRAVRADDFIYAFKRLADPVVGSPIGSLMAKHVKGFATLQKTLLAAHQKSKVVDYRDFTLLGVKKTGPHQVRIELKDAYPQFRYWLAMHFFAPIPYEVDLAYQESSGRAWSTQPIGTGPYRLTTYMPNARIVLEKNPLFRLETYPVPPPGSAMRMRALAGAKLPMIDKVVFSIEKESMPAWYKFLQGYYDQSGVGSDMFHQAIKMQGDHMVLTPDLAMRDIQLAQVTPPVWYYIGFNMLDPVVGGLDKRHLALRKAIALVVDYERYISLFLDGRGEVAYGPIPPGLDGYEPNPNPYLYTQEAGQWHKQSLEKARALMREAHYPDGVNLETGNPLMITLDVADGGTESKGFYTWLRQRFALIGVHLVIQQAPFSVLQDRLAKGSIQLFQMGWSADYPDPETFFTLFVGAHGKVKYQGENTMNYESTAFDKMYTQLQYLKLGSVRRHALVMDMVHLLQKDMPVLWGFFPKQVMLRQPWMSPFVYNHFAQGTLKYIALDPLLRAQTIIGRNQASMKGLMMVLGVLCIMMALLLWGYRVFRRNQSYVVRGPNKIKRKRL